VRGDPVRLSQILGNLLDNAARYLGDAGTIRVEARRDVDDRRALIRVSDTGPGLDAEELSRLFEPFVRGERHRLRGPAGLGLGLSIVRDLVELHDGEVRAQSEGAGKGATFSVWLPLGPDLEEPPEAPRHPPPCPDNCLDVLLVEDDADIAESTSLLIEALGHCVDRAADGAGALGKARATPYDLVLLDIGLPDMDGFEVAGKLMAAGGKYAPRLAAVTGYGDGQTRARLRDAGFEHVLVKPVGLDELQQLLAAVSGG
jgi:CheY-like chemotaxis protein